MENKNIHDEKIEKIYKPKKLERQLSIFKLLYNLQLLEYDELACEGIECSKKTFQRDIKELIDAGLEVKYEKKEVGYWGYTLKNKEIGNHVQSGTEAYKKHLEKLNRLCRVILNPLEPEKDIYLGFEEKPKDYKSPFVEWYKENFKNCSKTTMARDFEILENCGYTVRFEKIEKVYHIDFSSFYRM